MNTHKHKHIRVQKYVTDADMTINMHRLIFKHINNTNLDNFQCSVISRCQNPYSSNRVNGTQ